MARRGYENLPLKRYNYGVRICPEPVHWGGLSGSTYTEAVSWGKFVPEAEGGKFAEVLDDATVALPLIVGAVLERVGYKPSAGNAGPSHYAPASETHAHMHHKHGAKHNAPAAGKKPRHK
jgi:hypothetical protein